MVMEPREYYRKCNLKDNPFRSTPNYAVDPRANIWVGYQDQKSTFVKFLKRSLSDQIGNTNFLMLYGDYGAGKSHALMWAQHLILHKESQYFNSVCYFVPTLRKGKGNLTFTGAFSEDIVEKSNLLFDTLQYFDFFTECISAYKAVHSTDLSHEQVIEQLIPEVELRNFYMDLKNHSSPDELRNFFASSKLTEYQAMTYFTQLVNLFVHEIQISDSDFRQFKKAAYLFIDELDDLERAAAKETREVNDILRRIYESCSRNFCMVIALTAEIAQMPAMFYDYILTRIHRKIELAVLDVEDSVIFVHDILDFNRIDPNAETNFFPFEKAAVESITSQITENTPRKIVTIMQQVIEEVRLAGHNPDEGRVSQAFLDEHEIMEEVLE